MGSRIQIADSVAAGLAVTEYRPAGAAERTIVMLSSMGVSRRSWSTVGQVLGQRHRCLAVDITGHGTSASAKHFMTIQDFAEAVGTLLDHEQVNQAVLVGNSLGATICTELAAARPELVSHLVHVGSAVWESEIDRRQWLHSRSALFCRPDGMATELTADFVEAIFGGYDPDRHRMLREDQQRSGPRLGWVMWALYAYDTLATLARIGQPVLAVFGENDPYRGQSLPLLRGAQPRLEEVIVTDGSHLLPVDRGPELAANIQTWLEASIKHHR